MDWMQLSAICSPDSYSGSDGPQPPESSDDGSDDDTVENVGAFDVCSTSLAHCVRIARVVVKGRQDCREGG